jgi:hypothetical protein
MPEQQGARRGVGYGLQEGLTGFTGWEKRSPIERSMTGSPSSGFAGGWRSRGLAAGSAIS